MTDDIAEEDEADLDTPRRWITLSGAISVCLVCLVGSAITWNALFNQRPAVKDASARTIELKAKPAKPAAASKPSKPATVAAKPEIAVDLDRGAQAASDDSRAGAQTIAALQAELGKLGFYTGAANGQIDAATEAAIRRYRDENELDAAVALDGVLDHARFASRIADAANYVPITAAGTSPKPAAASEADAGGRDDIVFVQKGLAELGYAPGPADGHLGDITRRAIRDFQAERQLPITGDISPELIAELRKTSGLTTFLNRQ